MEELGQVLKEISRPLKISFPAVGYSVERGKAIVMEKDYGLIV